LKRERCTLSQREKTVPQEKKTGSSKEKKTNGCRCPKEKRIVSKKLKRPFSPGFYSFSSPRRTRE
jgi:hypothetical protein